MTEITTEEIGLMIFRGDQALVADGAAIYDESYEEVDFDEPQHGSVFPLEALPFLRVPGCSIHLVKRTSRIEILTNPRSTIDLQFFARQRDALRNLEEHDA